LTLGLVACLLGGAGLLVAPPAPASAASAVSVSISGDHVVRDWESAYYYIKVKNTGTTKLNYLYVEIYHGTLPLDFQSISDPSPFNCQIVDGLAAGGAKATCQATQLAVGDDATITLSTSTTWAGGSRVRNLVANVYYNYPASTIADAGDRFSVSVNP
jgi:hypothetical protein